MEDQEIKSLIDSAQIDSDLKALTATTDRIAPEELLALIGRHSEDWEITAITAGQNVTCVPASPIPREELLTWHLKRLTGESCGPAAIQRVEAGYYARVMGNAVMLEAWFRERGYHQALAGSPNAVWIGDVCPGRVVLRSGNYHECDTCGHIPHPEA